MKPYLPLSAIASLAVGLLAPSARAQTPPPPPTEVVYFSHDAVKQKFEKGGAFLVNSAYKVLAGHRNHLTSPAAVEIHLKDTDVFYILSGSATFVTGGTAVNITTIAPNEEHAESIQGGTERHLGKGDVIVIPPNTPHQFLSTDGAFLYFVVKVTQQ